MSEFVTEPGKHESIDYSAEERKDLKEHYDEKAAKAEHQPQKELDKIREHIEKQAQAIKSKELSVAPAEQASNDNQYYANREIKANAFERTLKTARKHLSKPEIALSKIIHQPAIDSISRFSEKTVARPSGILGGSLLTLLGSVMLVYLSKHYGYRYNFLTFFLLFIAGYILGSIIEFLLFLAFHSKHQQ